MNPCRSRAALIAFVSLANLLVAQEPKAPAAGEARVAWIADRTAEVATSTDAARADAIARLAEADQDGDCVAPLVAMLAPGQKDVPLVVAIVRGLGRDGLVAAAPALVAQLSHKDDDVRGNAAVSLEYVGATDKVTIAALRKFVGKEKDPAIANHGYRALGRCGREDAKVRALLLERAMSGKSEFESYGACIGLAHFAGDEKAARGVERVLKRIGVPAGMAGGGANAVKRSLVSWTLARIGNGESAAFVREELIAKLENTRAIWVEPLRNFWGIVARHCEGEPDLMPQIEAGVRASAGFARAAGLQRFGGETRDLMDGYRSGRSSGGFEPLGDGLLKPVSRQGTPGRE